MSARRDSRIGREEESEPRSGNEPEVPEVSPAILATNLGRTYGDIVALAPLDLRVERGERVSLIGHNGSGKTTFLQMASGLLEPSSGSVSMVGESVGSVAARAAVSYLADRPVFYDDLSLSEHLEYVARLHATDDWESHAAWLLDALGIDDRADDRPVTFSRGLQQRAAIAIAFVRPFDVLLVDEPFVGLDAAGRAALLDLVDWAHRDGATAVIATHELDAAALADRVVALADGSVVHDGPLDGTDPADLVGRPGARRPGS